MTIPRELALPHEAPVIILAAPLPDEVCEDAWAAGNSYHWLVEVMGLSPDEAKDRVFDRGQGIR